MLKAIVDPIVHRTNYSLDFLLPVLEYLPLKDLENFAQVSAKPLHNNPHLNVLSLILPHIAKTSIQKTAYGAFPSLSLQKLKNQFSLDDAKYKIMRTAILEPSIDEKDASLDFFLPLVEHLPLKDLAHFMLVSKQPLQMLRDSKHPQPPLQHLQTL